MATFTPRNWADGDHLTGAVLNAELRDGLNSKPAKDYLLVKAQDRGVFGNGVADDSAALAVAFADANAAGVRVLLDGDYALSADLSMSTDVLFSKAVTFRAKTYPVAAPTVSVVLPRYMDLAGVTFVGLKVRVEPTSIRRTRLDGCNFVDSLVSVGTDTAPVSNVEIRGCDFVATTGRTYDAITLTNASGVRIENNRIQEYRNGISIAPSISFANRRITIETNTITNCLLGISAVGTSMARISALTLANNTISSSARGATVTLAHGIKMNFCAKVDLDHNTIATAGVGVRAEATLGVIVRNNRIGVGATSSHRISAFGCAGWRIYDNGISAATGAYALLWTSANFGSLSANANPYAPSDLTVRSNRLSVVNSALKIENTTGARVFDNDFAATAALSASTGFLWFAGTTTGSHANNRYAAPSGTPVVVAATATAVTTEPQTLTTVAAPTKSVTAPVITAADPDLNNAKSYVVTFTISDPTLLHQMVDDDNDKALSAWMAGVTGATLAWNSSAWDLTNMNVGDIVVDGVPYDNVGPESYWSMKSAMVLDRYNRLTTRNWSQLPTNTSHPDGLSGAMAEEMAWQTATFRPPLVVDGTIYNPVPSGLIWDASYNTDLGGRMSLGQKADGTFVLVAVDGKSGVNGCTIAQMAAKHLALGSINAYNLDGGGSTTLWYNGAVINSPSDATGERALPAVMYV